MFLQNILIRAFFHAFLGNFVHANHQKEIIQFAERSALLNFLYDVMAPVAAFGKNGFLAQIGNGQDAEIKFLKIHVVSIGGDGAELDMLGGCQNGRMYRNCRLCLDATTAKLVYRSEDDIKYRNDNEHEFVVKRMAELWKRRKVASARGKQHIMLEGHKKLENNFNELDLTPGRNPLYRLFYYFNGIGISGFHQSLHPDRLHVILKGIVEKTIAWTLSIVYSIMTMSGKNGAYSESMGTLDARIKAFPNLQAYECFR